MDAKLAIFISDPERRLRRIETPLHSLTSGKLWDRFGQHLENSVSMMEQLRHLRSHSEAEQESMKQYLLLLTSHLGRWQLLKELISIGVDPNCRVDSTGQTPAQLAALAGHPRTLQFILAAPDVDIDAADSEGNSALMCAAQRGCHAAVEVLLDANINTSAANKRGYTALDYALAFGSFDAVKSLQNHLPRDYVSERWKTNCRFYVACCFEACENGWVEILEFLCDRGVPLCSRGPVSNSDFVFSACLYRQNRVLDFLKRKGVHLDEVDFAGASPIFLACHNGDLDVVDLLANAGCDINRQDGQGRTPAYVAASRGRFEVLKYLKDRGCSMEVVTESGDSLLHAAIDGGCYELFCYVWENSASLRDSADLRALVFRAASRLAGKILVQILEWRPDLLNCEDHGGNTPVLLACHRGCHSVLEKLKTLKADFSCANRKRKTPALRLSSIGDPELLRLVQEAGGKLDIPDSKGVTALLRAASFNHFSVVKVLAAARCRVDVCDTQGRTAVFYAARNKNEEMLRFLALANAPLDTETADRLTPLLVAAQQGCLGAVKFLLESGECRVGHVSLSGEGLALLCALNGSTEMMNLAIKYRVDLCSPDIHGNTPALNACAGGHLSLLKSLKAQDCSLKEKNHKKEGGLHFAARRGLSEIMRFLLEEKCNSNARDCSGHTPLMTAAEAGHENLLQMLHEHGCDLHIRSVKTGRNALHLACAHGHYECVSYLLLLKCDSQQTDLDGATPLMLACQSGSLETVNYLLQDGGVQMTIRYVDRQLQSCIHYAARCGKDTILRRLANLELSMDEPNLNGETPLMLAASSGCSRSFEYLLKNYHASVASVDKDGRTAVHRAAAIGCLPIIQLLKCSANADSGIMDRSDSKGMTPLMLAAENDSEVVFKFLRDECHCKENVKNANGENAAHLAARGGHVAVLRLMVHKPELIGMLTNKGESCLSLLIRVREAASLGRLYVLRSIIENPECDLDTVDSNGNTALHLAAMEGRSECLQLLLNSKNVERSLSVNGSGQSILHLSCKAGSQLCVDLLLEKQQFRSPEMINLQDNDGNTALMHAIDSVKSGSASDRIVKLLLNKGATTDVVNKHGLSPWRLAFSKHREDLLEQMEQQGHPSLSEHLLQAAIKDTGNANFIRDSVQGAIRARRMAFVRKVWPTATSSFEDIMGPCSDGGHILHACAVESLENMVEDLVKSGHNVDCLDGCGRTPFFVAVQHNRTSMAKKLRSFSCDINVANSKGVTALMKATKQLNYDFVNWLISCEARLDATDTRRRNALHWAATKSSSRIFSCLLNAPGGIEAAAQLDKDQMTPVMRLAQVGNFSALDNIASGNLRALLRPNDAFSAELLLQACAAGCCFLARWLYNQQAPLTNYDWVACLAAACSSGHVQIIREFASVPGGIPLKRKLFLAAGQSGDICMADHLVRLSLNILQSDFNDLKGDLLTAAIAHGHLSVVQHLLLHCNAAVDEENRWGNRPCHVAALCGQANVLSFLLKSQFQSRAIEKVLDSVPCNARGRSLINLASIGGSSEVLHVLNAEHESAGSPEAALKDVVKYDTPGFYKNLGLPRTLRIKAQQDASKEASMEWNAADQDDSSGISSNSSSAPTNPAQRDDSKSPTAFEQLDDDAFAVECKHVGEGADGSKLNDMGQTLLIVAARRNQPECVRHLLLNKRTPVPATDVLGRTALTWASALGHDGVLRAMWEADQFASAFSEAANLKDHSGMTPLMLAAVSGHADVTELLHEKGADLELMNTAGSTALLLASQYGQCATFARLLKVGANFRHRDRYGNTALVWAARRGHLEVIRELQNCHRMQVDDWCAKCEGKTAESWANALIIKTVPNLSTNVSEKQQTPSTRQESGR